MNLNSNVMVMEIVAVIRRGFPLTYIHTYIHSGFIHRLTPFFETKVLNTKILTRIFCFNHIHNTSFHTVQTVECRYYVLAFYVEKKLL